MRPSIGELTCEGCLAPVFMVRQGNWKLITCRTDPDQLYNLADDPHEHTNLAGDAAHADTLRKLKAMAAARWNPAQLEAVIRESQLVRLTVWHALREGKWYPWDYQPLRDASEQYMRNHKDLNVLEKTSRFPPPAQPEKEVRLIGPNRAPACPRPCRAPLPRRRTSAASRHGAP
jgi:choline-sulfatase